MSSNTTSVIMNATSIADYITKLEKENAESRLKIEQLKKLFEETDRARVAALEKSSLYESTARTKTYEVNKDIAEHLRELGEMTSDFYKTAAYRRAADIVATLDYEVENGESLLNINGIGKNIANRIDEFLAEYYDDSESVGSTDGQIIDSDSDSDFFVSYNADLTDEFDKLASYEEDPHKRDAYRKAADALYKLPFKVTSGTEISQGPLKVPGIAKKIDEFLTTGKIKKIEFPNIELANAIDSLAYHEKDEFKKAAYDDAAYVISRLTFKVTSGAELAKGPKKIPGIGKGIAKKIDEFLTTGKIRTSASTNEEVARHLESIESDDPFKTRAYRNAAEKIRELDFEVTNGEELSKGPKKIPGIGKSIAKKIDEFLLGN